MDQNNVIHLQQQVAKARAELKNTRAELKAATHVHHKQVEHLKQLLTAAVNGNPQQSGHHDNSSFKCQTSSRQKHGESLGQKEDVTPDLTPLRPIGRITSMYTSKNGTPRQGGVNEAGRGRLHLTSGLFTNPHHALQGLEGFSHVWILFIFHKNDHMTHCRAKVAPPRLDGARVGVFSTRCPYRPNPVGLTLAKLEKVQEQIDCVSGSTLSLSGLDLLDGTPVIDVKPYIPQYDCPHQNSPEGAKQQSIRGQTPGDTSQQTPGDTSQHTPGDTSQHTPGDTSHQTPGDTSQHTPGDTSQQTPGDTSQQTPGDTSQHTPGDTSQQTPGDTSQHTPGDTSQHTPGDTSQQTPGDTSQQTPGDTSQQTPGDIMKVSSDQLSDETALLGGDVHLTGASSDTSDDVRVAPWLQAPPVKPLKVTFTPDALHDLQQFELPGQGLQYLGGSVELRGSIEGVLGADPRSVYRRQRCQDRLYYVTVDTAHITAWFNRDTVQVLQVTPISSHTPQHHANE